MTATPHETSDWEMRRLTVQLEAGPEERLGAGPPGCGWVMVPHGLGAWAIIHAPSGTAVIFGLPCTLEAMRLTEVLALLAPSPEPRFDVERLAELLVKFSARLAALAADPEVYLARVVKAANAGRPALGATA